MPAVLIYHSSTSLTLALIDADTRAVEMLLANAVYFQSLWKYSFKSTEQGLFYKAKANSKLVTFIKAKQYFPTGFVQTNGQSGGAYWVEIPYAVIIKFERVTSSPVIWIETENATEGIIGELSMASGKHSN